MNGRKLRTAVVLGVLLVLVLGGEVGARDRAAVSAWKYVTIPAGHFHPVEAGYDWWNNGNLISLYSGSSAFFTAPVVFPGSGPVIVKKVILYAHDNSITGNVGVNLYKTNPLTGGETEMAYAQSALNSSIDPRVFSDATITYAKIQRTHGAYLWLGIDDSSGL